VRVVDTEGDGLVRDCDVCREMLRMGVTGRQFGGMTGMDTGKTMDTIQRRGTRYKDEG